MIRLAAAVAITVCVSPAWLYAQTTVLTVNTASADVYKSPSTGSPIIGHTPRGTVLAVTRELGSWVKVSWPGPQDVGYVHMSMGSLGHGVSPDAGPAGSPSARPAPETASLTPAVIRAERPPPYEPPAPMRPVFVTPATHLIGLGGQVGSTRVGGSTRMDGSTLGFGATARAWSRDKFGMQLAMSHYTLTSVEAPGRVTSIQFEPSVLYRLPDHVADYLWVRPYLGSGVNFRRQTLSQATSVAGSSVSENQFGLQAFGGGEMTFAGVPKFALSVDLGYHWVRTSFAGVDLGGPGVSVSGHWYVK
jgi:hypothetical protein